MWLVRGRGMDLPKCLPCPEVGVEEEVCGKLHAGRAKLGLVRVSGVQRDALGENICRTQTT